MADGKYRRLTCGACFTEFTQAGRGRNAKTCGECRPPRSTGEPSQRARQAPKPAPLTECKQCGKAIAEPRRGKLYCCRQCAYRAKDGTKLSRAEYREQSRQRAAGRFTCEHCWREAYRNLSGTNAARGSINRFCSMACRCAAAERVRLEIEALHRIGRMARASARPKRPEGHVLGVTYTPKVRTCICCGLQWSAIRRVGLSAYCPSPDCQQLRAAATRKARRGAGKHVNRAKRHGRRYGYFNVLRVFERDRWRCRLCGVKTPKALRGTQDPRAPEIDHIVPIADGGDHVIENCQCACRRCNGAKGARAVGQLWLHGFADTR